MDLIELKEKADRWQKLQALIRSMEADVERQEQLKDILTQYRIEEEKMRGCWEEYEAAWNTKRAEVEAAGGNAWNEVLRCQEEIFKAEERLRSLEEKDSTEMDPQEREYLKAMEMEHMQSMAEVIQWLVIEA